MTDETPDIVADAMAQGTFSFVDVVQGRSYPKDTVTLYQDEATAYERGKYLDSVLELRGDVSHKLVIESKQDEARQAAWKRAIDDDPEVAKRVAVFDAKLSASAFTFHLQGVPSDLYQELSTKADADFPPTKEKWKNPFDGRPMSTETPHPERNRRFAHLLWAAHITKIVDANGRADTAPGVEAAAAISKMPLSQQQKFSDAIDRLQVAAASFENLVDSDF